ncbi:hypothetical protein RFI_14831 [Reticulomyxa filosa]|uniref:Flavin-containing monooxygenase n=1 Tax=Reticulomyxa filosa TaxID=46433 RepID=X6N8M8_RETFI|nr:hypothetical protein RFI_14831 [Reticulomyxa filosa]|eukprot:ETO22366.1 hypothetical protein RFI_14831 [Reticulomyxa filosa]
MHKWFKLLQRKIRPKQRLIRISFRRFTAKNESVCVIGGGWSGLSALKELQEVGFKNVTLYESANSVGGIWNLQNADGYGWPQLLANVSKYTMFYPSFPWQSTNTKSNYASIDDINNYLNAYAKHFKLFPSIEFNKHVVSVRPVSPSSSTVINFAHLQMPYLKKKAYKKKKVIYTYARTF